MRKIYLVILSAVTCLLWGCGVEGDIYVDGTNKTIRSESHTYVTEEEYGSVDKENHTFTVVDIDDTKYYKSEKMEKLNTWEEINSGYDTVTDDTIIFNMNDASTGMSYDFIDLKVHLPFDIAYTNCNLLGDRTIQVTNPDIDVIIATSKKDAATGKNITLKNVTKGKTVKNKQIIGINDLATYDKEVSMNKFALSSKDSILLSVTLKYGNNSIKRNPIAVNSLVVGGIAVVRDNQLEIVGPKNGKYTLTAKLVSGYTKDFVYHIDTKRPTINVKSGKVLCKDVKVNGYASGIKTIKVNGKTVKNGYKVKSGDIIYTIDKAGNKTVREIK